MKLSNSRFNLICKRFDLNPKRPTLILERAEFEMQKSLQQVDLTKNRSRIKHSNNTFVNSRCMQHFTCAIQNIPINSPNPDSSWEAEHKDHHTTVQRVLSHNQYLLAFVSMGTCACATCSSGPPLHPDSFSP